MRARIGDLQDKIARLVDAVAKVGGSEAILARLRAAEDEQARLKASGQPAPRLSNVRDALNSMLLDLQVARQRDSERARLILADLLEHIALRVEGEQI